MNNFDQSSTGVNIELVAHYDSDFAQYLFDDNFVRVETDGSSAFNDYYRNVGTWLYIDEKSVDPDNYNKSKTVAIRGFCQGDYAEIIVPTNLSFKRGFDFQTYFENLFYRAPVYARIEIDGEEYYLDEYLSDLYQWDRAEVITGFEKNFNHDKKDIVMKWLEENLPMDLSYD